MNTDRTLGTSGQTCTDRFESIKEDLYKDDESCIEKVEKAMSGNDASECPEGIGGSGAGSAVQKCMSKSQATVDAWSNFIKGCEVMNVQNRGGEAEAAGDAKPSCFPRFSTLDEFTAYLKGEGAKSAAAPITMKTASLLVAVAAAVGFLL